MPYVNHAFGHVTPTDFRPRMKQVRFRVYRVRIGVRVKVRVRVRVRVSIKGRYVKEGKFERNKYPFSSQDAFVTSLRNISFSLRATERSIQNKTSYWLSAIRAVTMARICSSFLLF